jgi:hypothetical protein
VSRNKLVFEDHLQISVFKGRVKMSPLRDYFHLNENTELTEKDHLVREVPKTYLKKTSNLMSLYNKLT